MANQRSLSDHGAAHDHAAFSLRPDAGRLPIRGEDRVELLQRQTTSDLKRLPPGLPFHTQELRT